MNEHPTLRTVLDVANMFSLTLDAAHQLFGYDLNEIRNLDSRFNGGRTRIIESYAFSRDVPVELPTTLSSTQAFDTDALLRDLVLDWQTDLPIRVLDREAWRRRGSFYVQVGTEDSLGSSLPHGSIGLVEPLPEEELHQPSPRRIYLLQFGNGYRCSRCVVSRGKLVLLVARKNYPGSQMFSYPGEARIVGRVSTFALGLPMPEYSNIQSLPRAAGGAPLLLPWEQPSMDQLLAAEHRRFRRSSEEASKIRDELETIFHARLTGRTERRYRRPTPSEPHVNTLIQMVLANTARYTDSLRANGSLPSDRGRFSLEALLQVRRLGELGGGRRTAQEPQPGETWQARRREFPEWPSLLSMQFPRLRTWGDRIVRLAQSSAFPEIEPPISAGSLLLLGEATEAPDPVDYSRKLGWSRPLYALHRGTEFVFGHLDREGDHFALRSHRGGYESPMLLENDEHRELRPVHGIAVPV
jgi:hypothetical protein